MARQAVRWVRGQSAHPSGRPQRARTMADLLRKIGAEQVVFDDNGEINALARRERLARVLWAEAVAGNLMAARLVIEHMEGRAVQPVQVAGAVRFTAERCACAPP